MKKLIALLLALVMVLGLAACTPNDNGEDTKPNGEGDTTASKGTIAVIA